MNWILGKLGLSAAQFWIAVGIIGTLVLALWVAISRWEDAVAEGATYKAALDIARQINEGNARELERMQVEAGWQQKIAAEVRAENETWRQRVGRATVTTGAKHAGDTCPALDTYLDGLLGGRADGADQGAGDAHPD